jgi:hypothetical protein
MSKRTPEIPEWTRNFMEENVRNLEEMQCSMDEKVETKSKRTVFENMSAKVHSLVAFSQSKKAKATSMRISELAHKAFLGSHSRSVRNEKHGHARAQSSVPNETVPQSYKNNGEILSGDMAQSGHARAQDSVPNETVPQFYKNNGEILSGDMAQSGHARAQGSVPNESVPGSYINTGQILSGDMAKSGHAREQDSVPNETVPGSYINNGEILSGDMAKSGHARAQSSVPNESVPGSYINKGETLSDDMAKSGHARAQSSVPGSYINKGETLSDDMAKIGHTRAQSSVPGSDINKGETLSDYMAKIGHTRAQSSVPGSHINTGQILSGDMAKSGHTRAQSSVPRSYINTGQILSGDMAKSGHARAQSSVPNETVPGSDINTGQILSGDMAESVHDLITEDMNDVCTCTDLCIEEFAHDLPEDSEEPIAFTGMRSLGCQTVDSWDLEKYTRNPPLTTSRNSRKRLSSGGVEVSDDPDIMNVPFCEQEQEVQAGQSVVNATNIRKTAKPTKARQTSTETQSDPLRAPPTYRRGVIPKYLAKRLAAMREEAEEFKRLVPVPTCPLEHNAESESYRKKPPKILKEHHSDLVQVTKHVDARNLEELGAITYSSTRKVPRPRSRHSTMGLPTGGVTKLPGRSDDPDIQKLPQEVHQCQSVRDEVNYGTTNITPEEAGQASTEAASDPLRAPPTYQKGVVPKYLKKRLATMREAKSCRRYFPEAVCPLDHAPDSYRKDYMMMLKKRHSDLLLELKMLPVTTDIRMLYKKKTELEKKVKESEKIMRRFSELSILLH